MTPDAPWLKVPMFDPNVCESDPSMGIAAEYDNCSVLGAWGRLHEGTLALCLTHGAPNLVACLALICMLFGKTGKDPVQRRAFCNHLVSCRA